MSTTHTTLADFIDQEIVPAIDGVEDNFDVQGFGTPRISEADAPVVREIPPPLNCAVCGRNAQFEVDDTSACRLHYRQVYNRAAQRRQS